MDRKVLINQRISIPDEIRKSKEKAISERIAPFLKGNIGLYVPTQGEVNVFDYFKNNNIFLPVVISETTMHFVKYTGPLKKGAFGVWEPNGNKISPDQLDVIVVPVVGFHKTVRIGFGKGFYDRYLKDYKGLKIGVAFDIQEDTTIMKKKHDIEMDILITETRRIVRCE